MGDSVFFELTFLNEGASATLPGALEREFLIVEHHVAAQVRLAFEGVVASFPSAHKWSLKSSWRG